MVIIAICCSVVFIISFCALLYSRYKRKTYDHMTNALQEIVDEMNKYGVETIEELEAIKAQEQLKNKTNDENTKENMPTDIDNLHGKTPSVKQ